MNKRKILSHVALLVAAFALGITAASIRQQRQIATTAPRPSSPDARHPASDEPSTWYTCGMHPEVVQDHPGDCPKCGMKLQPMSQDRAVAMGLAEPEAGNAGLRKKGKIVYWKSSMIPGEVHEEPGKDSMGMDLVPVYADEVSPASSIRIDPVTEQNMGVRLDKVVIGPLTKTVRTVGFVDYDETRLATVNTKTDGWVEKLTVDQTGAQVHKGDPLFELYSPELFSAQEEYLAALDSTRGGPGSLIARSTSDAEGLSRDARTRLEYFDVSPEQIRELERTRRLRKTLTVRAPFTGIVTGKSVVAGQRVMAGKELFRIADLSTVWVIAKVYEQDLPFVKLGQEAFMTLSYVPGKTFRGRVTYVYPYVEAKTREISVRMEFHNPGYELKPGMYATVTLSSEVASDATLVPDVAVIDTGLRSVVFTMPEPGRFEAREVKTGLRTENNYLQVLSGLAPGETVVVSGQFLLDSESRLREAALKFMEPGQTSGANPIEAATRKAAEEHPGQAAPAEANLYYVCPMPEHVDILYDKPGKCPLCGMDLIPVRRRGDEVRKHRVAYWTCPMPEHSSVHERGPGKCPICGMSLVPVEEVRENSAATGAGEPHSHSGNDGG